MSWEFRAYRGYGPLTYGMTHEQVIQQLGTPESIVNSYESMQHALDPDVLGEHYIEVLKTQNTMSFSDSPTNNQRPEAIFSGDELTAFFLRDKNDTLVINGVNVWGSDRIAIIRQLAQRESTVLFSGSDYYFESIGVRITAPRFWKKNGSVGLYSRKGFDEEMDLAGPYEYAPGEITGQER
ncbi:MAG: hypothetical protein Q4G14_08895 [Paracoccus sp. (in: a-proteobacteria)]|uniref:hypothetical protein n=1 Tax=Paracoccus sp. TaxID=267 RepID=UPI0026E0F1DB|nr:hypothetical protein [Paracoccus sp. (in: a-proteobacteria)]MDO5613341.1 hypothetical protein [Paracoccus sp. (in: a-proteobacteria)]